MNKETKEYYWEGETSNVIKPTTLVTKDNDSWKKMWKNLVGGNKYPGDLKKGTMAIAVFCGEKRTKTKPVVSIIDLKGQDLNITWGEKTSKEVVKNHSPFIIMFVDKQEGNVSFNKKPLPAPHKPKGPTPKHLRKKRFGGFFGK